MTKLKVTYDSPLAYQEISNSIINYISSSTVIICIGTDKCIGDCLGPLVGTILESSLFPLPVYGTLSSPIHALNLENRMKEIQITHPNACILGIDACLGDTKSIGQIHTRDFAIHPGKGVGKSLKDVGTASIIGIVDSCDASDFFSSRSIRLSFILDMARVISKALLNAYLDKYGNNASL